MTFDRMRFGVGALAALLTFGMFVVVAFIPITVCNHAGDCLTYTGNQAIGWHPAFAAAPVIVGLFMAWQWWKWWADESRAIGWIIVIIMGPFASIAGAGAFETLFGGQPFIEPATSLKVLVVYAGTFAIAFGLLLAATRHDFLASRME
jgi:hypothetical protein